MAPEYRWYQHTDGTPVAVVAMAVRLTRAERREQTRQELLTAAEECFVTGGFHATSVEQVADRAGYTKGAVYSNFASKEDLFFAIYEGRVEWVLTHTVPRLREVAPQRAFDDLATATIDRREVDDGWLAVFFEFWAHVLRHPELRERFAAIHARVLEPVAEAVRQLIEVRESALLPGVTALQVAVAWNAMEIGLGLERLTQPDVVDAELARRIGRLLLDAAVDGEPRSNSSARGLRNRSMP
jgi:AcrR family transcriptional regulator